MPPTEHRNHPVGLEPPRTGGWTDLPSAPATTPPLPLDVASAWTGHEVLLWGTTFTYRPPVAPGREGTLTPEIVGLRFGP